MSGEATGHTAQVKVFSRVGEDETAPPTPGCAKKNINTYIYILTHLFKDSFVEA